MTIGVSYQVWRLKQLQHLFKCGLNPALNPDSMEIRTISHIVASWRLTQLRLRAILPYLTLCAQRSLLRSAIDQLDRLARADYCENFIGKEPK
jgi:hypothetical protein